MKTAKLIIAIVIIAAVILGVCTAGQEKAIFETEKDMFSYDKDPIRSWYLYIMGGLEQEDIEESVKESGAAAEYRVVHDFALLGYFYYTLRVYEDGTGRFVFMVHHSEWFDGTGELLLNKSRNINKEDTDMLLKVISDNDFWNIPTAQPGEKGSIDGTMVFIEGYSDGNTHFIWMSNPGKEYGIYKILQAFDDYSMKIAENPLGEYAEEYE